jgi:glycosyltransferase involved in cell wall biosynthesis
MEGGATHVLDLSLGLSPEQFEVTVGMPEDNGNVSAQQFTKAGIEFVPLTMQSGFAWRDIFTLRRVIKNGRFHIIHLHGARAAFYGRLAVLGLNNRPSVLFSVHGFTTPFYPLLKRVPLLWTERLLQPVTDCTICVAHAEADKFVSYGLTTHEQTRVVYYGIDVDLFANVDGSENGRLRQSFNLTDNDLIMLMLCRLHYPRDFDMLFKGMHAILPQHPNAHLLIAGEGPQQADLEANIAKLNLTNNVHLIGLRRDIPELLGLADINVLTSLGGDGFPISSMEAQAAGVPVVITDDAGSRESVLHGETGFVVPMGDAAKLAEAFSTLLSDANLRQKMGEAGRKRADPALRRETMVAAITAVYLDHMPPT